MKKVLVLTNSSGGLYDFRGEFIEALCASYEVWAVSYTHLTLPTIRLV